VRHVEGARAALVHEGAETVLFVDEVHRFNKAQQDALLPGVENRWVTLVGATTENPFFSVISPLLSRSLLLRLETLTDDDVREVIAQALVDERGLAGAYTGTGLSAQIDTRNALLAACGTLYSLLVYRAYALKLGDG